jgi:hypothetical protein
MGLLVHKRRGPGNHLHVARKEGQSSPGHRMAKNGLAVVASSHVRSWRCWLEVNNPGAGKSIHGPCPFLRFQGTVCASYNGLGHFQLEGIKRSEVDQCTDTYCEGQIPHISTLEFHTHRLKKKAGQELPTRLGEEL